MASTSGSSALTLAACVVGIYGSYLTQGVVQERLSTERYAAAEGGEDERFSHMVFLNLVQGVVCYVVAALVGLLRGDAKSDKSATLGEFWKPSVSNTIGPALGTIALRNISYPAQVLVKSGKMVPVMIMGALVGGVSYRASQYAQTALVGGGVAAFAWFKSSAKSLAKLQDANAPLGYTLCVGNLLLDGYTNAFQDDLKKRRPATTSIQMMAGTNFWCAVFSAAYCFGLSTVGADAVAFLLAHPAAMRDVLLFSLCGAVGQNFIFLTITEFGALVCVTVTTTRKFMNIMLSVLWNANPLLWQQWVAVSVVFLGLAWNILEKHAAAKAKAKRA